VIPNEDLKEGRTGHPIYLGLKISRYRENCNDTMCDEGQDPFPSIELKYYPMLRQWWGGTHHTLENLRGMVVPMQEPAWNKGISFDSNLACGSEVATMATIADKFPARRKSNDASTTLFPP
jgi:hypothetical protein